MTDASRSSKTQLTRALDDIQGLCEFAYEQGFHEMGYDPVKAVREFVRIAIFELASVEKEIGIPSRAIQFMEKCQS